MFGPSELFESPAFTSRSELASVGAAIAETGSSARTATMTALRCKSLDEVVLLVTGLFQTKGCHKRAPPSERRRASSSQLLKHH